jgi:glycosyltransferase involved in cell wall biosynthesis
MLRSVIPLLQRYPGLIVDVVGDGAVYPGMQLELARARRLGVDGRIVFHGWLGREELGNVFREAHVLLLPSVYPEAFGIVGIESLMHGKPVVAFDVGGVREWLQDGESGFLVPPRDTAAFAESICRLLDDKDLYRLMSRAARQRALAKFTAPNHVNGVLAIYQDAAAEESRDVGEETCVASLEC